MPSNDVLFDVLKRFANTLAHRYDVADVLYELTEHALEVLGATSAGVSLADADGVTKFVTASSEAAAELERLQQDSQQGPCHHAYQTASTVLLANIADSGDWPLYRSKCEEVGLHAVAGIPLTTGDRRLGAMNIYQNEPRNWTDDDVAAARVPRRRSHQLRRARLRARPSPAHQRAAAAGAQLADHHRASQRSHRRRTRHPR